MKLQVYQFYWGMVELPFDGDEEWSMEEKLEKIAEAGFDGVEFLMEEKAHRDAIVSLCDQLRLKRSNIVFPWTPEEFDDDIKAAQDGGASHINLQPMPMPRRVADGVSYIVRCMDRGCGRISALFETHRDRMTTDMHFTLDLIEAVPDMVLCGDLSHFLVGREFAGPPISEQNQQYMDQILARCGAFHARIASREQVQVKATGFAHNQVRVDLYESWWEYGFKQFKERAGEDDVMTLCRRTGPPTYAIQGADGRELSDRWEEAVRNEGSRACDLGTLLARIDGA